MQGASQRERPEGPSYPREPPPTEVGSTHNLPPKGEGRDIVHPGLLYTVHPRAVPPPIRAPDRLAAKVRAYPG